MSQTPNLKRNYIYKLIYEILTLITPFITAPYVSRVLGADGIGIYSYTQSLMTYFTMFAALGTASYGMREIAMCRDDKVECSKKFWEIEFLTVLTSGVCLMAWMVLVFLSSSYKIFFVALIPSLLATMFDISWFYTGLEKIGYTVFWNIICKITGVACILLFIKDKDDLFLYILLNSGIIMLGNLSMWVFLPIMLVKANPRDIRLKHHFKETLVYFIPTIATSVYTVLDKTLIGFITKDNYQNGYYEQATKMINMAKTAVFVSVNSVMGARISYLFAGNKIDEIKRRINRSLDFILFLGYAAMFGIIAIAKDLVPIFFGDGYEPVIGLLYWMSPLIVIIGFSNCLGSQYYTPAGLRKQSAKYIVTGSIVNLCMNMILIPALGSTGAVMGSIVAEVTISLLYIGHCGDYMTVDQIWRCSYKRILAGMVMLAAIRLVSIFPMGAILLLGLEIVCGMCVYFVALIILKDSMVFDLYGILKGKVCRNGRSKN